MSELRTLGWEDEPRQSGAVVAVRYGDYHRVELWQRSGANFGNWYCLGNEFGIPRGLPTHPHWEDVLARGPVTLLVAGEKEAYASGWVNGRRRLVEQIETLSEEGEPE